MSKDDSTGKIQWDRLIKKLSPYTVQKGLRYLKHYGLKEFWIRLHERFEPEEVPYGPWYEAYRPDEETLEKQRKRRCWTLSLHRHMRTGSCVWQTEARRIQTCRLC